LIGTEKNKQAGMLSICWLEFEKCTCQEYSNNRRLPSSQD
jgi:hypothetical protein